MRRLLLLLALAAAGLAPPAAAQDAATVDSLRRAAETGSTDERAATYQRLAVAVLAQDPKQAMGYGRAFLALAATAGDRKLQANADRLVGGLYYYRGERDSALHYVGRAVEGFEAVRDTLLLAETTNLRGAIHYGAGRYNVAIRDYLAALRLFEALGNDARVGAIHNNVGLVHRQMGDQEVARQHYRRALGVYEREGSQIGAAFALHNLGISLSETGDPDGATAYYSRALQIYDGLDPDALSPNERGTLALSRARTSAAQGTAHLRAGRPRAAVPPLRRAMAVLERADAKGDLPPVYGNLADALSRLGRAEEGLTVMRRSLALADSTGDLAHQAGATLLSAKLLAAEGAYRDAYAQMLRHQAYADSLRRGAVAEAVAETQARFDVEGAERRAEAEAQRAEIAELRMGRQRLLLLAAGAGLLLVLALAGALWRTARLRRRANALLAEKNAEVEQQKAEAEAALGRTERLLAEREVLLREVHHRVKNNLQVVASLVNLQAGTVHDPAAVAALRQMRARVEAMALVHRRLYGDDDLRTVGAGTYLGELAGLLAASYPGGDVEVAVADVALDADTAVPLGLATAELVANAFEHAFPEGNPLGRVRLALEAPSPGRLRLVVEDGGGGLPPGLAAPPADSLGLQLASDLAAQLGGRLEMGRSPALGGARLALDFPAPPARLASGDGVAAPPASVRPTAQPAV